MEHLLAGRVAERPFPKVIYALVAHAFTGTLVLEHEGRTWTVWWKDGAVVDADSATPEDSLGRVLLAEGLIDGAKLADLLRRMAQNPERRPVDLLAEAGALAGDALARAARTGLVARARRIFGLPEATYHCEAQAHERSDGGPLDGRWLVYRGLRAHYDAARLGHDLAPLEAYAIKLLQGREADLGVFGFGDEERIVLAYLAKGYWSLADLLDATPGLPQATVMSLVYALLACELLDVKPANSVPRLRKRAREETLNVNAPAAQAVLSKAAARPTAGPPSVPPPPTPTVPPPVVASTARPNADIRDKILKKFKEIDAGADLFKVLEVPPTASTSEVMSSYFALAKTFHPDRLAALKLEDMRPQVERIFARISEAKSVLGDDAKRAEYRKVVAAGGEQAVRKREEEEQRLAMAILEAEEQFRVGEMALRRNQPAQAMECFRKAIELNPSESEHHALYAWAMWMNAPDKNAALQPVKQLFAKALEINDQCVPAYYYLGHIYVFQQDWARALAQFKRAVELRPGYVDAERELRLLEMRRQKGQLTQPPPKSGGLFKKK
jgi:tetratricopeptide (TPR) repeat protein